MLFNSVGFWIFLLAFTIAYHGIARTVSQRMWLIALGSLFFYGAWDVRFVPLLLGTALIDYWVARAIDATPKTNKPRRRRLLIASLTVNLGVLGLFKYLGFFLDSAFGLFRLFGVRVAPPVLHLALPIGLSFYTFQSMSYTIDVYRRKLRPAKNAVELVAAVTFFPHLVAGPIIRASTLLPQLEAPRLPTRLEARRAWLLIGTGLFSKNIGDLLAPGVEGAFASAPHDPLLAWNGALGFAAQLYGDFAGYSAIAIGVALLLGFRIPRNFDLPYLAESIPDFWRRWHISLSTWIREYCFFPLALRYPKYPRLVLVGTMTLVGLWHGASWPMVAYGVYHGCLIVAGDTLAEVDLPLARFVPPTLARIGRIAVTFYLVVLGLVLFRAGGFARALTYIRNMHSLHAWRWPSVSTLTGLALSVGALILCHALSALESKEEQSPILLRPVALYVLVGVCLATSMALGNSGAQFIYFQF